MGRGTQPALRTGLRRLQDAKTYSQGFGIVVREGGQPERPPDIRLKNPASIGALQVCGASPMKKIVTLCLLLLLSVFAFAADGKSVSYKSGDDTVAGVLYTPAGSGPFPALIVIHEWWGLNDWVKEQA